MRTSRFVEGFGTYQFDTDLYEVAMTQTVAQLRERVHGGCEGMESGTRTKVNKLRKADLAAMVAEWDTAARDNEFQADQAVNEAPSLPATLPITVTDVAIAEVYVVVQLRGKLYDGKLISVVNRRTTLSPAFLVTVELEDGIRRLVRADHTLAA